MDELLLIDLSSIFWSAWHASVNKEVSTARNETVSRVRALITRYPKAAVCCDSAKSWRKELAPTYKANRPEKDQAAVNELRETKEMLRKDGALLWECETFEADDIIATATKHALARKWVVVIATGDKDLAQLVCGDVVMLNTRDNQTVDEFGVKTKFGVHPSQMLDYLTLVGDASDNIEGVRGIGPKTACALLEKFGSINGIYNALDETPELFTKPAIKAALLESGPIVDLAQRLIALRDDCPIKFEEIDEERVPEPLTNEDVDMSEPEETAFTPIAEQLLQAPEKPAEKPIAQPTELQRMPPRSVGASFEHGLEPNSLEYAVKLAMRLHESRLYAKKFPNPDAILAIVIRGRELGWGALAAMDAFHCFEGRPMLQAHAIISLVKAHPDCEYFTCIETTPESCTYETKHRRNPKPTRLTYTLVQARNAGLVRQGSNWEKRPDEMVRKTCAVQLARIEFPDAAMGIYAMEEMGYDVAA